MFTLAVWGRKGGSGKTTLAASLGAFAASQGSRAVLIDADAQGSLVAWSQAREAAEPTVATSSLLGLEAALTAATAAGYSEAILDLPGSLGPQEARALALADVVLIPVRPSFLDLNAAAASIAVAKAAKARAVVVLTQVRVRSPEAAQVRAALADLAPVLAPIISELVGFPRAISGGFGPTEFEPSGAAANEVRALATALADLRRNPHG